MNRNFANPFFTGLMLGNRAQKVPQKTYRFNGQPGPGLAAAESVGNAVVPQSLAPQTLNVGRRSANNVETPLHANAITLTLTNLGIAGTGAAAQADLVLTAGDFDSEFTGRVITDGTAAYTNDAGQSVNVAVTCEYGVDGSVDSWANARKWIQKDGLAIAMTRIAWTQHAQRAKKLRFQRREFFGDHVVDSIFPEVYYDPKNYDLKVVDTQIGYPLDAKTILKYSLVPAESVVLTFWVAAIHEQERVLSSYLRTRGGNTLG